MVAMLLFFTAVVKLMSLFGSKTTYIYNPDPLFLEFQSIYFILGAGFMEIVFASCLFLIRSRKTKTLLTLWLSSVFVAYRIGLWYYYPTHVSCGCMGSFSEWVNLSEKTVDLIAFGILVFMISGSFLILILSYFNKKTRM